MVTLRGISNIAEIIREVANPEKVILFGSYAKGEFVEHRYIGKDGIRYEYVSDYDFLIVTKDSQVKEYELDDVITNRARMYRTPVNLEIHEINYINEGLEFGQYFFADIVKEGIVLFDKGTVGFASPRILSNDEQRERSSNYFKIWFMRGIEFLIDANHAFERSSLNKAAFELHQAAESFYYATLLVFTGYKPKTHNLGKLRKQCKSLSEALYLLFPIEGEKKERHLFDLLKRGYVDARYKQDYLITKDELTTLIARLTSMRILVEGICSEKIEQF